MGDQQGTECGAGKIPPGGQSTRTQGGCDSDKTGEVIGKASDVTTGVEGRGMD